MRRHSGARLRARAAHLPQPRRRRGRAPGDVHRRLPRAAALRPPRARLDLALPDRDEQVLRRPRAAPADGRRRRAARGRPIRTIRSRAASASELLTRALDALPRAVPRGGAPVRRLRPHAGRGRRGARRARGHHEIAQLPRARAARDGAARGGRNRRGERGLRGEAARNRRRRAGSNGRGRRSSSRRAGRGQRALAELGEQPLPPAVAARLDARLAAELDASPLAARRARRRRAAPRRVALGRGRRRRGGRVRAQHGRRRPSAEARAALRATATHRAARCATPWRPPPPIRPPPSPSRDHRAAQDPGAREEVPAG